MWPGLVEEVKAMKVGDVLYWGLGRVSTRTVQFAFRNLTNWAATQAGFKVKQHFISDEGLMEITRLAYLKLDILLES